MDPYLTYQAVWQEAWLWIEAVKAQAERMLRLGNTILFVREQLNSDDEVWGWLAEHCPEIYAEGREQLQDAWDYALECAEERSFAE